MRSYFLLFFLFIVICSCGKKDNDEYVDDRRVTNKDDTKHNNSVQKDSSDKSGSSKNDKGSNEKSFRDEKPVAVITPLEAGDYTGKTVTVKGFVADVYKSEKVAYLNFVEKYPDNPFTAVIFADKFSDFGDIQKFKGKNVEVTGRVSMYKNKPQIILNNESQIKIAGK